MDVLEILPREYNCSFVRIKGHMRTANSKSSPYIVHPQAERLRCSTSPHRFCRQGFASSEADGAT